MLHIFGHVGIGVWEAVGGSELWVGGFFTYPLMVRRKTQKIFLVVV